MSMASSRRILSKNPLSILPVTEHYAERYGNIDGIVRKVCTSHFYDLRIYEWSRCLASVDKPTAWIHNKCYGKRHLSDRQSKFGELVWTRLSNNFRRFWSGENRTCRGSMVIIGWPVLFDFIFHIFTKVHTLTVGSLMKDILDQIIHNHQSVSQICENIAQETRKFF